MGKQMPLGTSDGKLYDLDWVLSKGHAHRKVLPDAYTQSGKKLPGVRVVFAQV
jgi:hypothetical protein